MSYYMTGTNVTGAAAGFGQDMARGGRAGRASVYRPALRRSTPGYRGAAGEYFLTGQGEYFMTGANGFGAADASAVCSDWNAGASGDNAAGNRAASIIQQTLNDQGYGPLAVDGVFGSNSIAAWNRFAQAHPGTQMDWPDCSGIQTLLSGGGAKSSKASMAMGIALAGLVVLGALAVFAKKKHKGAAPHHAAKHDTLTIVEK